MFRLRSPVSEVTKSGFRGYEVWLQRLRSPVSEVTISGFRGYDASRQLKPHEIRYAPLQEEAWAVVWSLRYFHHYIHGRHFTVVTDHRPLKWLQTMKIPSNLMTRWMAEIQGYDFTNVDTLSRYPVLVAVLDGQKLCDMQAKGEHCGKWIDFIKCGTVHGDKELVDKMKDSKDLHVVKDGILFS